MVSGDGSGQIIFEWTVLPWFFAGGFQPGNVLGIFGPLQQFFVICNR